MFIEPMYVPVNGLQYVGQLLETKKQNETEHTLSMRSKTEGGGTGRGEYM